MMEEFRTSAEINEVAAALAAAQGELPVVEKNKTATVKGTAQSGNKYEYTYNYADIADVYAAALPILSKNGLCIVQPTVIESGSMFIRTRLIHGTSGQWLESDYPVCSISGDHQKMGGALTYARRYAACTLVGIVSEDDRDGEVAVDEAKKDTRRTNGNSEKPKPQVQQPPSSQQPLPPRVGQQPPADPVTLIDALSDAETIEALDEARNSDRFKSVFATLSADDQEQVIAAGKKRREQLQDQAAREHPVNGG